MPYHDLATTFPRQSPLNGLTLREPIDENLLDKCIHSDLLKTNYRDNKWFKNEKTQLEKFKEHIERVMKKTIEIIGFFVAFSASVAGIFLRLRACMACYCHCRYFLIVIYAHTQPRTCTYTYDTHTSIADLGILCRRACFPKG